MSLSTDQVVQGRYRVVAMLGRGGMAAIYRARDTRLNVLVALKEMTPQPGIDRHALEQLQQQFEQEAKILARLDHPNLVRVTDFFSWNGAAYLVMNLVQGETLADRIEHVGAMTEDQALILARQLLDALAYCHSQGILHRDIKPQNVIIRQDGRPVLVDFGLVKLWDPHDQRTKTAMQGMGTPEYASPEQYSGDLGHTDPRSDIYSLGATLYHALTGQAPVTATMRISDPECFVPLRGVIANVSAQTEHVVMKALELTRSQRWPSMLDMATALGVSIETTSLQPSDEAVLLVQSERRRTGVMGELPAWLESPPTDQPLSTSTPAPPQLTPRPPAAESVARPISQPPSPVAPARRPNWLVITGGLVGLALIAALVWVFVLRKPLAAAPEPVMPYNNTILRGPYASIVLEWSSKTPLADDEYYLLSLDCPRQDSQQHLEVWVKQPRYDVPTALYDSLVEPRRCQWSVTVAARVGEGDQQRVESRSAASVSRVFTWLYTTPTPTLTATSTQTSSPTPTQTSSPIPSWTPTTTPSSTPTDTPTPTATNTRIWPTRTHTPMPTLTFTPPPPKPEKDDHGGGEPPPP